MLWSLWSLAMLAALSAGCAAPTTPLIGDDEFVGRPADTAASTDAETDAPPPRHGAIWYRIEPLDDHLQIQIRLLKPPSTTTFFLPGPWAGSDDFDRRITVENAIGPDSDDPLPMSVDDDSGRIDIDTGTAQWVELSYRVDTPARGHVSNRFAPWRETDGFFAYGPTILILPSAGLARQLRDIPVEVHIPPDWQLSTTWPVERAPTDGSQRQIGGFVADDISALRDAFVGAGASWRQRETHWSDAVLRLTLTGEFGFDEQQFHSVTAELTRTYLDRFGHYNQLSALVIPAAEGQLRGTGRRGGFVLEVLPDAQLDDNLLILLAHEAFHMWNGHRLVPDPSHRDETQWFNEGLTHYVGLKTLARLDLIDDDAVRTELARAAQYYLHNPIVAGGHIRSIDRTRLPYDRGLLIALALDLELVARTGGTIELEDWIAALLSEPFADRSRGYDPDVLRDSFQALTDDLGPGPMRRYDSLLRPGAHVDVSALFERLGLHFLDSRRDDSARLLPLDGNTDPFDALFNSPVPRR